MNYTIRKAIVEDLDVLLDLCEKHAAYEQNPFSKNGKIKKLNRLLFTNEPKLHCLMVVDYQGEGIGYATFAKQISTWEANEYVYLDCIFLIDDARGFGIGEKIMEEVAKMSRALGCKLIQWQTPDFNKRAIKFYKRIGASSKEKVRFFLEV